MMLLDPHPPDNEEAAADPRRLFAREPAVDLAGVRVAVLGCGSVGGLAAWALAGAGIGTLYLADRDRLEPANLRRHVGAAADLGQPKARVVARFLNARLPHVQTTAEDVCFLDRPEIVRERIAAAEAVLVAVDAEGPKHLIDASARELGRPAVYAGVYGGGWGVEVVLSDAARGTPCYACAARALGRTGIPVWPAEPTADYALPAADVPASDWARADLSSLLPCAALAARVLVACLADRRGHGTALREFTRGGATAWRLPLRRIPGWGGPCALLPVVVPAVPGCPVCGSAAASPQRLEALLRGGES
jgi:molybdopterin-synthase adenylyltransferase